MLLQTFLLFSYEVRVVYFEDFFLIGGLFIVFLIAAVLRHGSRKHSPSNPTSAAGHFVNQAGWYKNVLGQEITYHPGAEHGLEREPTRRSSAFAFVLPILTACFGLIFFFGDNYTERVEKVNPTAQYYLVDLPPTEGSHINLAMTVDTAEQNEFVAFKDRFDQESTLETQHGFQSDPYWFSPSMRPYYYWRK